MSMSDLRCTVPLGKAQVGRVLPRGADASDSVAQGRAIRAQSLRPTLTALRGPPARPPRPPPRPPSCVRPVPCPRPSPSTSTATVKVRVVRRALLGDDAVRRASRPRACTSLLQRGLRVLGRRRDVLGDQRSEGARAPSRAAASMPGVEVERGDKRLEDVLERRRRVPRPPVPSSLVAQDERLGESEVARRPTRATVPATTRDLDAGQAAFGHRREAAVELLGDDEAEHRVAEELEPLVVARRDRASSTAEGCVSARCSSSRSAKRWPRICSARSQLRRRCSSVECRACARHRPATTAARRRAWRCVRRSRTSCSSRPSSSALRATFGT